MNQRQLLEEMFSSQTFPVLSKDNVDLIESCYILDYKSIIKPRISSIIDFFCYSLPDSQNYASEEDPETLDLQSRIIKLIRLTKHNDFSPENLTNIENKFILIVKTNGPLQEEALCFLIDHFMFSQEACQRNEFNDFMNFLFDYADNGYKNMESCDLNILTSIIGSVKNLMISATQIKKERNQSEFLRWISLLMKIVDSSLSFIMTESFSPKIERICSKSLKILGKLIETMPQVNQQIMQMILSINDKIPKEAKYLRIYESFLTICLAIYMKGEDANPAIKEVVRTNLINNFSNYSQKPLSRERKLTMFLMYVNRGLKDFNDAEFIKRLLSNVYRLASTYSFSHVQGSIISKSGIIYSICNSARYKKDTLELNDITDQCMSLLNLMENEHEHNTEQWLDVSLNAALMLKLLLPQFLDLHTSEKTSRIDILTRFTKYVAKAFTIVKSVNDKMKAAKEDPKKLKIKYYQRNKLTEVVNIYFDILHYLPEDWSFMFFQRNIQYLAQLVVFYRLKALMKLNSPITFLIVLAQYMTDNYESLDRQFFEYAQKMYEYSLTTDSQIKGTNQEIDQLNEQLLLTMITSVKNNYVNIIETIIYSLFDTNFKQLVQNKPSKLQPFIKLVSAHSYNWMHILHNLRKNVVYSRLALLMYPNLNIQNFHQIWFETFLTVLEECDDKKGDHSHFYRAVEEDLPKFIKNEKKFANALTNILARKNGGNVNFVKHLVAQIPEIFSAAARELPDNQTQDELTVVFNGSPIPIETFFSAYETSGKEDTEYLFGVFSCAVNDLTYNEATTNKTMNKIFKFLVEKSKELLGNLPMNYAGYFYRFLAFEDVEIPDEEVYDFLRNSYFQYLYEDKVKTMLQLTDKFIDKIEFGMKWVELLVPMLQFPTKDANYAIDIIKRRFMSRSYSSPEEKQVLKEINACAQRNLRQNAKMVIAFLTELHKLPEVPQYQAKYCETFLQSIEQMLPRLQFPFCRVIMPILFTMDLRGVNCIGFCEAIINNLNNDKTEEKCVRLKGKFTRPIMQIITSKQYLDKINQDGISIDLFATRRFLFKALARTLVSLQDQSQATTKYILAFRLFNEKKYHMYLPMFLKSLEKSVNKGFGTLNLIPREPSQLLHMDSKSIPSKTDLRILQFLAKTGLFATRAQFIINFLYSTLSNIRLNQAIQKRSRILFYAETISDIIYSISLLDEDIKIAPCIAETVTFTLFCRNAKQPLDVNFEKAIIAYPQVYINVLAASYIKDESANILIYLESLYSNKNLLPFTMKCIENIFQNFAAIQAFFTKSKQKNTAEVFTKFLYSTSTVIENSNIGTNDFVSISKLVFKLCSAYLKEISAYYKPFYLLSLMNIFYPKNIKELLKDNEALVSQTMKESFHIVLRNPELFHHGIFIHRMAFVFAQFPTQHESLMNSFRDQAIEDITQVTMFYQVLYQYLKFFPIEETNTAVYEISDNIGTESCTIYQKAIYEYSVARVFKHNNVTVSNIMEKSQHNLWHDIQETMIQRGMIQKDSILTKSRITRLYLRNKIDLSDEFDKVLNTTPFTPGVSLLHHIASAVQFNLSQKENVERYLYSMIINFISSTTQIYQKSVRVFLDWIKFLSNDFDEKYSRLFYAIFVQLISKFIAEAQAKDLPSYILKYAPLLESVYEYADSTLIAPDAIKNIKTFINQQLQGDQIPQRCSAIYFLLPYVAKIVFADQNFCPPALTISQIISNKQLFDIIITNGTNALAAASRFGKEKITVPILIDTFNAFSKRIQISKPLDNPLSTVLKWSNEANFSFYGTIVDCLTKAFLPKYEDEILEQIERIHPPFGPTYTKILLDRIRKYPKIKEVQKLKRTSSLLYILPDIIKERESPLTTTEMINMLWSNPWHNQFEDSHIYIFSGIVMPYQLSELILYLEINKLQLVLYEFVSRLEKSSQNFRRFMMFYVSNFPHSTLSQLFYTMPQFKDALPLPSDSYLRNIEYLNNISLPFDAIGIMKTRFTSDSSSNLFIAGSFNQLSHYSIAKEYYLKAIDDDVSNFSISCFMMRPLIFNTQSNVITNDTKNMSNEFLIVKLFSPETNTMVAQNSVLIPNSRYTIPFLTPLERLSFSEEAKQMSKNIIKIAQVQLQGQPTLPSPSVSNAVEAKVARKLQVLPSDSLDLNCSTISSLDYRIREMRRCGGENLLIQSLIAINRNRLSILLSRSGCFKKASKVFLQSLNTQFSLDQIIKPQLIQVPQVPAQYNMTQQQQAQQLLLKKQQQAQQAAAQFQDIRRPMPINVLNIGRVYKTISQFKTQLIKPVVQQGTSHHQSHLTIQQQQQQNQQLQQQAAALKPFEMTKIRFFYELRDIRGMLEYFRPNPIDAANSLNIITFIIRYYPALVDKEKIFHILFNLISQQQLTDIAMAAALYYIRKVPQSTSNFVAALDKEPSTKDKLFAWLTWVPLVLLTIENQNFQFVKKIISSTNSYNYFRATMQNVKTALLQLPEEARKKQNKIIDELNLSLQAEKKLWSKISEYDSTMAWGRKCEQDILDYQKKLTLYMKLSECFAAGKDPSDAILNETGQDYVSFCEQNPPYFKTDYQIISADTYTSFKIPSLNDYFYAYIDAKGDKEATIEFINTEGTHSKCILSSNLLYQISYNEMLFLKCLNKLFDNHPSAKQKSKFLSIQQIYIYYIHKNLVLVQKNGATLPTITQRNRIAELARIHAAKRGSQSQTEPTGPAEILERKDYQNRDRELEKNTQLKLFKWVADAANGNSTDFIVMRQSLCSNLAAISAIKFLFKSSFSQYQSFIFTNDRLTLFTTDYTTYRNRVVHLPFTETIKSIFPDFMLQGSFATTWQIVMDSIARNQDRVFLFIAGILNQKEIDGQIAIAKDVCDRASLLQTAQSEETEKEGDPFPFALIDHLIQTSTDAFTCQEIGFSWF